VVLLFLKGAALALPATLQPGPLQALLASLALTHGVRRSLPAAFAPLFTDGLIISLVLLVLTRMPTAVLRGMRVAGGLFLVYLSVEVLRALRRPPPTGQAHQLDGRDSFWKAVVMNFLNPNAYLFWGLAAGPILLDAWRASPALGIAFVAGFYVTFVAGLAGFIVIVGSARQLDPRVHQSLLVVAGLALAGFGVWQIVGGAAAFLGHGP
jgi:threonine/homoserine/homoserine lactone efflux protein